MFVFRRMLAIVNDAVGANPALAALGAVVGEPHLGFHQLDQRFLQFDFGMAAFRFRLIGHGSLLERVGHHAAGIDRLVENVLESAHYSP